MIVVKIRSCNGGRLTYHDRTGFGDDCVMVDTGVRRLVLEPADRS